MAKKETLFDKKNNFLAFLMLAVILLSLIVINDAIRRPQSVSSRAASPSYSVGR